MYSADGLSITLTGTAGGFGGKTGLYEIIGLPIKVKTKSGYQLALPGDSIDLAYPNINSRRGRVGHDVAHTLTTSCNQGYYAMCIDMNPEPKVTELARCITSRQDSGIGHHKGEKSGVIVISDPIAVLTPEKEKVRQQGRRFKLPNEPMFTITVTDKHGGDLLRIYPQAHAFGMLAFAGVYRRAVQQGGGNRNVRRTALQAGRKCGNNKCY